MSEYDFVGWIDSGAWDFTMRALFKSLALQSDLAFDELSTIYCGLRSRVFNEFPMTVRYEALEIFDDCFFSAFPRLISAE